MTPFWTGQMVTDRCRKRDREYVMRWLLRFWMCRRGQTAGAPGLEGKVRLREGLQMSPESVQMVMRSKKVRNFGLNLLFLKPG